MHSGRERLRRRIESYKSELRRMDVKIGRLQNERETVLKRLDEAMQRLRTPTASLGNDKARSGTRTTCRSCQESVSGPDRVSSWW